MAVYNARNWSATHYASKEHRPSLASCYIAMYNYCSARLYDINLYTQNNILNKRISGLTRYFNIHTYVIPFSALTLLLYLGQVLVLLYKWSSWY